jgi:hypothetical protein
VKNKMDIGHQVCVAMDIGHQVCVAMDIGHGANPIKRVRSSHYWHEEGERSFARTP